MLARALRNIFPEAKLQSIISKLPPRCKVHGFDIGDFTGDDGADVVVSVEDSKKRNKELTVLFFINRGAEFTLDQTLLRRYITEPIEVGFSIEQGLCSITQKLDEYHWEISSYSFQSSLFREMMHWETQRLRIGQTSPSIGYESQDDYRTLRSSEVYYRVSDNKVLMRQEFFALPVFPAGVKLASDIRTEIGGQHMRMIRHGASSWSGWDDAEVTLSSRYDSQFVEITVAIRDDILLGKRDIDEPDRLDLIFDISGKGKVEVNGKARMGEGDDILFVRVLMGNAADTQPEVQLPFGMPSTGGKVRPSVKHAFRTIELGHYEITVFVPTSLFSNHFLGRSIGFTASYFDVDRVDHSDWVTILATADYFDGSKVATFGRMDFYPSGEVYFEREDLRTRRISSLMNEAGIAVEK